MTIVLAGLAVTFGAFVQGTLGFGIALVSVPLVALVEPTLVPVPMLLVTTVHAFLTLGREHHDTDWTGVGWALLGRLPGVALGVLAVIVLAPRWLTVIVAGTVLGCVALSVVRWRPRPTAPALVLAGVVSGTGGTVAGIGGPPVALLYQDARGSQVRATLAAYFSVGSLLSLLGLSLTGQFTGDAVRAAAVLLPFMAVGFALSGPARRFLDRGWTRPVVLAVAAAGSLALLADSLLR